MVVNTPVELTDEMRALLEIGAKTYLGWICSIAEVKRAPSLGKLESMKLIYSDGFAWRIQEAGREAVGGPTLSELHQKEWNALCDGRAC